MTLGWERQKWKKKRQRDGYAARPITMCKYPRFPLRKRQEQNDSGVLRAVSFSYPYCSSVCMYCAGREEGGRPGSWAILCYSFASRGAGSAKYAVTIS